MSAGEAREQLPPPENSPVRSSEHGCVGRTAVERFVAGTTTQRLIGVVPRDVVLDLHLCSRCVIVVHRKAYEPHGLGLSNHSSPDGLQILGHCGTVINSTMVQDTSTGIPWYLSIAC